MGHSPTSRAKSCSAVRAAISVVLRMPVKFIKPYPAMTLQSVKLSMSVPRREGSGIAETASVKGTPAGDVMEVVLRYIGHEVQGSIEPAAAQEPGGQISAVKPFQPQPAGLVQFSWAVMPGPEVMRPLGQGLQGENFRPNVVFDEP
jgi:hypothetical protein